MNNLLKNFIQKNIRSEVVEIDVFRKKVLQSIADYVVQKYKTTGTANILFICTHNSRRSHLAQVWAHTAAAFFNLKNIHCFSGGTEVSAVYPAVLEALQNVGFKYSKEIKLQNPKYQLTFADSQAPITIFSKLYDNKTYNPNKGFCAVMTCANAEKKCPILQGVECRFALYYADPQKADETDLKSEVYKKRSKQIAVEMFFLMSQISKALKE